MDNNDSFSLSLNKQLIEKKYATVSWHITNVRSRAEKEGGVIESPLFECSGSRWQLALYPNIVEKFCAPHRVGNPYRSDLFLKELKMSSGSSKRNFVALSRIHAFDIRGNLLLSVSNDLIYTRLHGSEEIRIETWDRDPLIAAKDLSISCSIWVEDDFFTAAPQGEPTEACTDKCPPEKKHAATNTSSSDSKLFLHDYALTETYDEVSALSNYFEALHENPRYADVILKVGELEFPAHKLVLRSRSKVFEAMFEHDMQENLKNTVDLVKMDEDTANDMLRYIYCGRVRHLWPEDALHLYVAADRYDLQGLVCKCREIMLSGLSVDNVCEISVVADLHNDQLLKNAVISLISKDMKEVLKTDKWKDFSKENPNLSLNLIQSVILNEKVNITSVL